MLPNKTYTIQADVVQLQNELREVFEREGYRVVTTSDPAGHTVTLQAQKNIWGLPAWTGAASALTVKIIILDSGTDVSVYGQKWTAQILTALAGFILFAILGLVTGGVGCLLYAALAIPAYAAYEQYRITKRVGESIDVHMARVSFG